jgi:hypothetical protein
VYVWGALVACRRLHRRLADEPRHVRIVAFALTAIAATVLGLQAGQLWGAVWEAIRVRNGHMSSFRAASDTRWLVHHVEAVFAIAFLLFVLVARFSQHATRFDLVRRAVLFAATMLAAMFADVFVRHPIGYMILANALAAFLYVVWRALTPPQSVINQPFHPRLGLWHNRPL